MRLVGSERWIRTVDPLTRRADEHHARKESRPTGALSMHPKTFQPHARKARNPDRARWLRRIAAHLAAHVRNDGVAVAWAFLLRTLIAPWRRPARDPGERAAERFLRALNYRVLARNWRSPRDQRQHWRHASEPSVRPARACVPTSHAQKQLQCREETQIASDIFSRPPRHETHRIVHGKIFEK